MLTLEPTPLLAGWDMSPGLIALHLEPEGTAMRLYHRRGEATVTERVPFSPALLVTERSLLEGARGLTSLGDLEGAGRLRGLGVTIFQIDSVYEAACRD